MMEVRKEREERRRRKREGKSHHGEFSPTRCSGENYYAVLSNVHSSVTQEVFDVEHVPTYERREGGAISGQFGKHARRSETASLAEGLNFRARHRVDQGDQI